MPYVKQEIRDEVDEAINNLLTAIENTEKIYIDGTLNYIFTRFLDTLYDGSYYDYNRAMGLLSCVGHEFYRKKVVMHEDIAMIKNGEVFRGKVLCMK